MLSVEELWREALPEETACLAGASGLGRTVTRALLLRPLTAASAPRGAEIVLLDPATLGHTETRPSWSRVVRALADADAAALAALPPVGGEAIAAAEVMGLPLLALPKGTDLAALEITLNRVLFEARTTLTSRAQEFSAALMQHAIDGRGLPAIVADLASAVQGCALLVDPSGVPIQPAPREASALAARSEAARSALHGLPLNSSDPPVASVGNGDGRSVLAAPVVVGGRLWGLLLAAPAHASVGSWERLAVARAAVVCAVEAAKQEALALAEDRWQRDLLDDLLDGRPLDAEAALARARRLGWEPGERRVALAVGLLAQPGHSTARLEPADDALVATTRRWLAGREGRPLLARRERAVVGFVAHAGRDALKQAAGQLRQAVLAERPGTTVVVGVGRFHPDLPGLAASAREAEQALALGSRLLPEGGVAHYADLGVYRLLTSLREPAELEAFWQETLGGLARCGPRRAAELIETLEAYFACHGSPTEAAAALHLHRNTLLYRLARIQELTGTNLADPETRLALQVALKVRRVLAANGKSV